MNIACDNPCVTCPPTGARNGSGLIIPDPLDSNNPFLNLSSEAPDVDPFLFNWYPPPGMPPLGTVWYAVGCIGICESSVSQEEAILCAQRQSVLCTAPEWPVVPVNTGGTLGNPVRRQVFTNAPVSCQSICPDGTPFTFTVMAGKFNAFSQLEADELARSYACTHAENNRICLTSLNRDAGCLGENFTATINGNTQHIGPEPSLVFSITSGALPPGLSLHKTGLQQAQITGTPVAVGTYTFSILAQDSAGFGVTKTYAIYIVAIATAALSGGTVGTPYSQTLISTGPASGPITWQILVGSLPPGLALNASTGLISGTPTLAVTRAFTVVRSDGRVQCHKELSITVASNECGGTPATIAGLVWTSEVRPGSQGFVTASFSGSGGSGTFSTSTPDPVISGGILFSATFCNNTNLDITLRFNFNVAYGCFDDNGGGALHIDETSVFSFFFFECPAAGNATPSYDWVIPAHTTASIAWFCETGQAALSGTFNIVQV